MKSAKTKPTLGMIMMAVLMILGLAACGDTGASANPTPEAKQTPTALPEPTREPTTQASSDGWTTFTSEADGFSVDMPVNPQASTRTADSPLGELTFYFFQLTDGNAQYAVAYTDYPVPAEELNAEQVLSDAIQGGVQGAEVQNMQTVEVQGNTGIEGEINAQGVTHIWYRAILVENRLYQLIVSSPEADKDQFTNEARRFIDS